ncbi:unnamed protein product [Chilo suppressalis]|uniref:ABC transporter domain-containing protein n=3 Tax=Chilo suppressalis TaxID=168631 RepID=A0ABN8B7T3_CHISP|nr:unnamed protein product [Chilo suppressalis]
MTISTLIAGVLIGISLSNILAHLDKNKNAYMTTHKKVLSVEALEQKTTIVVKLDNTTSARSVANAYVLSDTKATDKEIQDMRYTAIPHSESMTEYLVTRAIDSPQHYVYMYAYGVDVSSVAGGGLLVRARYSPLHHDEGAAARSLARAYMALLRHYTGALDASIRVTDDPLSLDLALWMRYAEKPPLLIQFILILTISHITLIPSMEHGLVRHLQCNARNFSPARYWLSMFCCDLLLYWCQVCIMTIALVSIVHVSIPLVDFSYMDLAIVPVMLLVYGFGCIPQAYLFSIGPRTALNTMTFVIINVVFGETTVIAKILYGEGLNYALYFMRLSPQFNMAYAYVKIKQIFLYNSECVLFKSRNLCNSTKFHKCCENCGILQECFSRKEYFTIKPGVLVEMIAIIGTAVVFTALLLLWEYRLIQRLWRYLVVSWIEVEKPVDMVESIGLKREKADVEDKMKEIRFKRREKVDTFGEYLLAENVLREEKGYYLLRNINLGVGKGEVLAVSGLQRHGRVKLCEILAGYKIPTSGHVWCMSKWKLKIQPYMYTRNISISCDRSPLPHWMKVYDALALLAVLRGVPRKHLANELKNYIEALDLKQQVDMRIYDLPPNDRKRLHFAAGVIGAPPVLIMDECTAYQKYAVRRSMYSILYVLKKRGHAIVVSASSVEPHLAITSRLAILVDGHIYDIDHVDRLVQRYSSDGYTIVLHLKDEINVLHMFSKHFREVVINDVSEVLVNVQVLDKNLKWGQVFERMEALKADNPQVYSYIVSATPIDYIYNSIIANERGLKPTPDLISLLCLKSVLAQRVLKVPRKEALDRLIPFETKYSITRLKELPWSVIFQR